MRLSDYDYDLPPECIAQTPAEPRDAARLLVPHPEADGVAHRIVRDLPDLLERDDLLVVNDTRVRPARLHARRPSGGRVELLLLEPVQGGWRALVKPAKKQRAGARLMVAAGVELEFVERELEADGTPAATWLVRLHAEGGRSDDEVLDALGEVPLPPYIQRAAGVEDRERYQTVYARELGSVAAPTAGLHLTREVLEQLESKGVRHASVTLHVGLGTFAAVQTDDVRDHVMHREVYHLPEATALAVQRCRERGGRVVAVGTTSTRVLETCAQEGGLVRAGAGETRLFLHPPQRPQVVDRLLTNFHLPRTTLLMLVASFLGRGRTLDLYAQAIEEGYRFFSYGDAMLIDRAPSLPREG